MTNDKLPEDLVKSISDAASLSASIQNFHYPNDVWSISEVAEREHIAGYELGATAWAPWKVKFDELKKEFIDLGKRYNTAQATMTDQAQQHQQLKGVAQRMADALEKLNNAIDKTWNECNTKAIPDKYKKEIATAQALSYKYHQQFKDGGKEVVRPEHNVSIGEHITYCHDCGFPVDECNCIENNNPTK